MESWLMACHMLPRATNLCCAAKSTAFFVTSAASARTDHMSQSQPDCQVLPSARSLSDKWQLQLIGGRVIQLFLLLTASTTSSP